MANKDTKTKISSTSPISKAKNKSIKNKEINQKFKESIKQSSTEKKSIKVDVSGFKNKKTFQVILWIVIFILSFGIIDFIFQYINNDMSVAIVNGERVSMSDFYNELEKAAGAQISETIIENTLIQQEGRKNNVVVPQEDIDSIINDYKTYVGGEDAFNEELAAQNTTLEEVEEGLETTLMAKEMITADIIVDDATLEQFYNDYKDQLYSEEATTTFAEKKDDIRKVYIDQQFLQLRDTWVEELKADAVIQNNFNDKPKYGLFKLTINIVKGLYQMVTGGNEADVSSEV